MSRTLRTVLWLGALAVAAVVGGAVSTLLNGWFGASAAAAAPPPAARKRAATASNPTSAIVGRTLDKVGDLEERVQELERAGSSDAGEQQADAEADATAAAQAEAAPPAEFYHERHAERLRQHRAEPVDPNWGPAVTDMLRSDLAGLTEVGKFELVDVECRNQSCRAVARWDDVKAAQENYKYLVTAGFKANCGRTMVIPDAEPGQPVEAALILDCEEWKGAGSVPLGTGQ